MKKNLFEMGAKFEDGWSSDNKRRKEQESIKILEPSKHKLIIKKEKRRGKVVTIIEPFYISKENLKSLIKELKSKFGCGGTIKNNSIELQGKLSLELKEYLKKSSFNFK